tara:strand:- start:239 stop:454 length:216 start_codon:yes stop_codon:yes gene_type:complete
MFKVGDLVLYLPFTAGYHGWVMYEGIGIVMSVDRMNDRGKVEYTIKWVTNFRESSISGDFLVKLEDTWNTK